MHVLVLTVFAALLAASHGATATTPAPLPEDPFMVSLMKYSTVEKKWFHNCSATILDQYNVLSAAHCYLEDPKAQYAVRAGSNYRNKGGVVISVTKVFPHPKFDLESRDYDVAIFRIEEALTYSLTISPIQLPPKITPEEGTLFFTVSMGTDTLQEAMVATIKQAKCTQEYKGFRKVTDRMICTQRNNKDASCAGDSGGAIYRLKSSQTGLTFTQYGLYSWSKGCAEENERLWWSARDPAVYCNLADPEIRNHIDSALKRK